MEEGVHFVSQLMDCAPEDLRAGMPVEAVFVAVDEDMTLVKFRIRKGLTASTDL
jgi:uncharacterized OB-fold protein